MKKLLVYALVVLAVSLSANAMEITYTVSFDDSYSGSFNINEILSVPQFDSSMGTLLNVKIDGGIRANGTIGFENTTANPYTGSIATYFGDPVQSTNGTLELKFNGAAIADVAWDVQEIYSMNLTAFDGGYDFTGTSGFLRTYLFKIDNANLYYDNGLSAFIGGSTVNFDLIGNAVSAISMPGNGMSQVITIGQGDVTITYEYIPEPMTMALMGIGGLLLRKKK
jgi:hypothetical protein